MRFRGCFLAAVVAVLATPAAAGAASTVTMGNVTPPSDSTGAVTCPAPPPDQILAANTQNGFVPDYVVPGGDGPLLLTQWQLNATGAAVGAQVTLVVVRVNFTAETVSVVATDTEALNPVGLPANGVETFTPANPIEVQPGDVITLYLGNATGIPCYWTGAPAAEGISGFVVTTPPSAGQTLSPTNQTGAATAQHATLNLGATLTPLSYDAGLSMSSGPSNAVVGQTAVLTGAIANKGPYAGPITLTDTVPAGLTVDYAAAASGSCTVAGSTVTCLFGNVAVGQSENAAIVVTPTAAKTFTDTGSVADAEGSTDPNSANNDATTTLKVSAVAVPKCVVPKLGGASESLAKRLLALLDCKVGKVKKATSKSVPKGDVISTSPGAGSYAAGKSIGITISSGKPKTKKKKKK